MSGNTDDEDNFVDASISAPLQPALSNEDSRRAPVPAHNPNPELVASLAALQEDHDALITSYAASADRASRAAEELAELKRVNLQLMDENESFALLLGERTLSGQLLGQGVFSRSWENSPEMANGAGDRFMPSPLMNGSSGLQEVAEEDDEDGEDELRQILEDRGAGSASSGAVAADTNTRRRQSKSTANARTVGLDLAAELDRAQDAKRIESRPMHARDMSSQSTAGMSEDRTSIVVALL